MLEQYKQRLARLEIESKDKDSDWIGWVQIEKLQEIIAKYTLFEKVS